MLANQSKFAIFFLPGMACNSKLWQKVSPLLPPLIHQEFFEFKNSSTLSQMHAEIDAQYANHQQVCLLGFSMGGYIALEYLLTKARPNCLLVLSSISAHGYRAAEIERRKALIEQVRSGSSDWRKPERLALFLNPKHADFSENLAMLTKMANETGSDTFISQQSATLNRCNRLDDISSLNNPALLLHGNRDNLVTTSQMLTMSTVMPNSEFSEIADTGHMLPLEEPKQFAAILLDWLKKASSNVRAEIEKATTNQQRQP